MNREEITAMLGGLDGVTPGPWIAPPTPSSMAGWPIVASTGRLIADVNYVQRTQIDPFVEGDKAFNSESKRNAAHIVRCDPDTIRALCALALRGLEVNTSAKPVNEWSFSLTNAALRAENEKLRSAGSALIADVKRRHPGEELRCPFMRGLDEALERKPE